MLSKFHKNCKSCGKNITIGNPSGKFIPYEDDSCTEFHNCVGKPTEVESSDQIIHLIKGIFVNINQIKENQALLFESNKKNLSELQKIQRHFGIQ